MARRRSDQEWQALFQQYETSNLTQRAFCEQNNLSSSTFFAKRQRLLQSGAEQTSGFVKAQLIEKTTHYQAARTPVANMTLLLGDIELSIPQGTPASYIAELIGALS
ncbi:IS66 family insertion sequence element accessory protein TnpA [Thaumasiovibrio sp. DFM-14]|uniref:IS66 family insertion sequence element accessory protein TnpA n=1 Tax=Thaumasiovibrio sp. DFM-14 TaxID=3384792 RepID=UPI0039A0CBC9